MNPKYKNIIGQTINCLTILDEISVPYVRKAENRKTILKLRCRCICGNVFETYKTNVLTGKTTKCLNCANLKVKFGEKYGSLTLLRRENNRYLCKCDCGKEDLCTMHMLSKAVDKRCRFCRHEKKYAPKKTRQEAIKNLIEFQHLKHNQAKLKKIGKKIGRLKVIEFSHWVNSKNRRYAYYRCKCKCGNEFFTRGEITTKSCGCLRKEKILRGENQPQAKLTNKQAEAIRAFKKANIGYTGRQIADIFGTNEHAVSDILKGKTYIIKNKR